MPDFLRLTVNCPKCESSEVTYTCEPMCCFNHLCPKCYTTFELSTNLKGEHSGLVETPAGETDTCAPTVACARCESLEVFVLRDAGKAESGNLVCASCRALLELVLTPN